MSQLVLDTLVVSLRNSNNPFLASIFGFQKHFIESDPHLQQAILLKSERSVYGTEGLEGFEAKHLPETERLARRTLAQFLCQQQEIEYGWVKAVWWLGMTASLPFLLLYLLVHTFRSRGRSVPREALDAEIIVFVKWERVRSILCAVFPGRRLYVHSEGLVYLGLSQWAYILRIFWACPRILLHPKLVANILRWFASYGYIVHHFAPRAVAHCSELVASSSVLTGYLRECGAKHLNVTHGERVFSAHGGFCEFDEDYVWGQHFADNAVRLKERAKFVIRCGELHTELYEKYRGISQPREKRLLIVHNGFLLPDGPDFQALVTALELLDNSWDVLIRRHPAWDREFTAYLNKLQSAPSLVKKGIVIREEPPTSISLKEALAKSRVVVGSSSTALIEGWIAGCKVIYLGGKVHPSTVIDRHQGSENIFYADSNLSRERLERFLSEPAVLTGQESVRLNYLINVGLNA